MRLRHHSFPLRLLALAVCAGAVPAKGVDYHRDIKPLLQERCFSCHGALKQKADLRLDTAAAMRKGGESGDILTGELPLLLERVTTTDKHDRMPPEGEGSLLNADQVAKLKAWIAAGAPAPADEQPEADPRTHWAYQPPKSAGKSMDLLLAARLEANQLSPQPEAPPEVWLRRVYLDLIGLPPSLEDMASFMKDSSPPARRRVVDHLLSTPQYGERWARHFMDLWRYSDWYGLGDQLRYSQKHLWHWRDWIVESLNADKGYDQMIVQMLAADELAPEDRENLRATGFLARSYYLFNRTTWLDATLEHTSRAFLGLTMQCVKCHDHKYDPVEFDDYYRMRAVFEPLHVRLDPLPGVTDLEKDGLPRVYDLHLDRPTWRHVRGDEANVDKTRTMSPGVPSVLEFASFKPQTVPLPVASQRPALLPFVLTDHLRAAESDIASAKRKLDAVAKADAATSSATLLAEDPFTRLSAERWEVIDGSWTTTAAGLRQHDVGAKRRMLRLRSAPPTDFSAGLEFTLHGGERWKSTGIAFDIGDGHEVLVYLSGAAADSKLQVSLTTAGKPAYPATGRVPLQVVHGKRYKLEITVQGQTVQAAVDGKSLLKFDLPAPRRTGLLALTAFDADVEYHHFQLSSLASSALLEAQASLAAALAKPAMIRAVHAAERSPEEKALARAAAEAEAHYRVARARADLALALGDTKAKDADKKVAAAKDALQQAEKRAADPGEAYTPLPASLKAQEGPDDADHTKVQHYPATSTGRRLAFARWIADRRNPLTARVLVNQVWMRHFGSPLVANVDDFGRRSPAPLHQDILDTLAVAFMDSGWSLKQLHRTLVLSDLYGRSSSALNAPAPTLTADPDNAFYWRMNPRRMESQVVRDSMLHLAGMLDLTTGGPSINPVKLETSARRSLYFAQTANDEHRFLSIFDNANVLECYRRNESVVPQQALALTNSQLSFDSAAGLASRFQSLTAEAFVTRSFTAVLGRAPSASEQQTCMDGLSSMRQDRTLFVQALLNHNDFVTLR